MKKVAFTKYLWLTLLGWTILIALLTTNAIHNIKKNAEIEVREFANFYFNRDETTLIWLSIHRNFNLSKSNELSINDSIQITEKESLSESKNKSITSYPNYFLTQQIPEFRSNDSIKIHIASLNNKISETAPDQWETYALQSLAKGKKNISGFDEINGKQYFRSIHPLIVKQGCLNCHSKQNYSIGDIMGGISLSIPNKKYSEYAEAKIRKQLYRSFIVLSLGFLLIFFGGKSLQKKEKERLEARKRLEEQKRNLEKIVQNRTAELYKTNKKLKEEIEKGEKLKEVLQKLDRIINNSQIVAFIWENNPDWPVKFVTKNVSNILGYSVDDFISGKILFADIIHQDDLKLLNKKVNLISDNYTIKRFSTKNYRLITKTGKTIWVEDNTTIIRDSNGNITHFEGIITDISKRKQIEDEIQFKTEFESQIASILQHPS